MNRTTTSSTRSWPASQRQRREVSDCLFTWLPPPSFSLLSLLSSLLSYIPMYASLCQSVSICNVRVTWVQMTCFSDRAVTAELPQCHQPVLTNEPGNGCRQMRLASHHTVRVVLCSSHTLAVTWYALRPCFWMFVGNYGSHWHSCYVWPNNTNTSFSVKDFLAVAAEDQPYPVSPTDTI